MGQIAKISIDKAIAAHELQEALNYYISNDLSVKSISQSDKDFNPRTKAISRLYEYTITCVQARSPQNSRYSWEVKELLDVEAMQYAASTLPRNPVSWSPFAAQSLCILGAIGPVCSVVIYNMFNSMVDETTHASDNVITPIPKVIKMMSSHTRASKMQPQCCHVMHQLVLIC